MFSEAGADPKNFQRGVEKETFERKMFVDTRINARVYTGKLDKHATLSLFFLFKRLIFYFLLCFITLFYCNPRNPTPLDPPLL